MKLDYLLMFGQELVFNKAIKPDAIHIATEGPIGTMARRYCLKII